MCVYSPSPYFAPTSRSSAFPSLHSWLHPSFLPFVQDLSPNFDNLVPGTVVNVGAILFNKIESEEDVKVT